MSLTDFGKQPRLGVRALGSGSPSPKASSRLTADASGSRAQRGAGVLFSSRFPESLQRRIDFPIAIDLIVQPNHGTLRVLQLKSEIRKPKIIPSLRRRGGAKRRGGRSPCNFSA